MGNSIDGVPDALGDRFKRLRERAP